MKKSILRVSVIGVAVAVVGLLMLVGCEDAASTNNGGLVDGFLVRVNEKPGSSGGGSETRYEVTISSDVPGATGGGKYLKDMAVIIDAGTAPIGRPFVKWTTTSKGVIFVDSSKLRTQFTMPASNVTVTAVFWTYSGWSSVTDARDGKKYFTTTIGGQVWMAENLNYTTSSGSWCYDNDNSKCVDYGRLYDWNTATAACITGWHLPSREEWNKLVTAAGGDYVAEDKLKAKRGWGDYGNGTDDYGFMALPGGYRDGYFADAGYFGRWWTATEDGSGNAYMRDMYNDRAILGGVREAYVDKSLGFSVRCVKDD